jgi:hypothetical protein
MVDILFWWTGFAVWLLLACCGIGWLAVSASDRRVRESLNRPPWKVYSRPSESRGIKKPA